MFVNNPTSCKYLFNKEAKELFPHQDEAFVDESLKKVMAVIDHLVASNPEAFFIFDPTAYNDQCHLYALFAAQAVRPGQKVIDRRFLYLSFLLSKAFLDANLLEKLACKALTAMNEGPPSKEFRLFLKDSEGKRAPAARAALNLLFSEHVKRTLSSSEGPLFFELAAIAKEDLQLPASNQKGTFYTFPKFAGVIYLMDAIAKEKIPLLFKVKAMTKEGNGSFTYSSQDVRALDKAAPVIVFEMAVTGESLALYRDIPDIKRECPSHFLRNVKRKERHDPKAPCQFCNPNRIDVSSFEQKFLSILKDSDAMLLALGADFVEKKQQPFCRFFSDSGKYPALTELFKKSLPNIQSLCLSMSKPLNMTVAHVYLDSAEHASRNDLLIDASYEDHLKARGLI